MYEHDFLPKGGMAVERLDKRLSQAGYSRKEARELIRQGRVRVDGQVLAQPEAKCPEGAAVTVDGQSLAQGFAYIMLHKPQGCVCATQDRRERTVLELLPQELRRRELFPVGRLDKDTTGLLLLTDDGELAHRLLSPKRHVAKTYYVEVEGVLDEGDVSAFAGGMTLADGTRCMPAQLLPTDAHRGFVTLREGKYHQVKRMCAARGKPVRRLERVGFGPLGLDPELEPGAWRELTAQEVEALRAAVSAKNMGAV